MCLYQARQHDEVAGLRLSERAGASSAQTLHVLF